METHLQINLKNKNVNYSSSPSYINQLLVRNQKQQKNCLQTIVEVAMVQVVFNVFLKNIIVLKNQLLIIVAILANKSKSLTERRDGLLAILMESNNAWEKALLKNCSNKLEKDAKYMDICL